MGIQFSSRRPRPRHYRHYASLADEDETKSLLESRLPPSEQMSTLSLGRSINSSKTTLVSISSSYSGKEDTSHKHEAKAFPAACKSMKIEYDKVIESVKGPNHVFEHTRETDQAVEALETVFKGKSFDDCIKLDRKTKARREFKEGVSILEATMKDLINRHHDALRTDIIQSKTIHQGYERSRKTALQDLAKNMQAFRLRSDTAA